MKKNILLCLCLVALGGCASKQLSNPLERKISSATQALCSNASVFQRLNTSRPAAARSIEIYYENGSLETARKAEIAAARANSMLEAYFGFALGKTFHLYIVSSRSSLDAFTGTANEDWVVGTAVTPYDVVILDDAAWTEKTKKFVNFNKLIHHEMVHSFTMQLGAGDSRKCFYGHIGPIEMFWLDEGMATYLSGQLEDWKSDIKKYDFEKYSQFSDSLDQADSYAVSATTVEFLIQRLGKEKILEIFRKLPEGFQLDSQHDIANALVKSEIGGEVPLKDLERDWVEFVRREYL